MISILRDTILIQNINMWHTYIIIQSRGRWTFALTFEPDVDAVDTKSDVVILGLSSENTDPLEYIYHMSGLDFPTQQSIMIYADIIGLIGELRLLDCLLP